MFLTFRNPQTYKNLCLINPRYFQWRFLYRRVQKGFLWLRQHAVSSRARHGDTTWQTYWQNLHRAFARASLQEGLKGHRLQQLSHQKKVFF